MKKMEIISLVFVALFTLVACSSQVVYKAPDSSGIPLPRDSSQIEETQPVKAPVRNKEEKLALFQRTQKRVYPAAVSVCFQVAEINRARCAWSFSYSDDEAVSAYASNENQIVVYGGLIDQIAHQEELAFVLAHEAGHHIANHIRESSKRSSTGAILGGIAGAIIVQDIDDQEEQLEKITKAAQLGRDLAVKSFSIEQELEADYLAIEILKLAEVDLEKARQLHIRMSTPYQKSIKFRDTHPSSIERLRAFDIAKPAPKRFKLHKPNKPANTNHKMVEAKFVDVVGSYCLYEHNGKKLPKPLESTGCPPTYFFKQ